MLARLLTSIAAVALIGAALLGLRQQRMERLHAMAQLHVQMDRDRKATWDAQAIIAEGIHPPALHAAVDRAGLTLEPLPTTTPPTEIAAAASMREWPNPETFTHAPGPLSPIRHFPSADSGLASDE